VYDIVFISYYEAEARQNFDDLYKRFNSIGVLGDRVKHVKNVKGIHNAHYEASKLANTSYFFVVDGDAVITQDFTFDYYTQVEDIVHVWKCKNPINDLVYGYGGVKLLPTLLTRSMDKTTVDMTTSISDKFEVVNEVSNITKFNTDEWSTWKSAFRECAKLASKTIDRQEQGETDERLKTWTTVGHDRPFGKYALAGATAGMEFGLSSGSDLRLINNFDWLKEQFNA
tara:strand:- start:1730 stop:2410 length:681 start_codon:yes stop_codon:yes gene_type:complete